MQPPEECDANEYVVDAMQNLGWAPSVTDQAVLDVLNEATGIVDAFLKLRDETPAIFDECETPAESAGRAAEFAA